MEQHITCPSCGTLAATLQVVAHHRIAPQAKPVDPDTPEWVTRFIEDRCRLDSALQIAAGDLWDAYAAWAQENGVTAVSLKRFGMEIGLLPGVTRSRRAAARLYVGIGLRST